MCMEAGGKVVVVLGSCLFHLEGDFQDGGIKEKGRLNFALYRTCRC